ncbi:AraC family transcriptional regulator [Paenibacillus sp. H1-7]|uniref:helix-turn-helix domain-containing protein n=1 Tax=Paenibacillus sp. H1-7 TaxID=2282849 RepID=UPI001EF827C3|nr:helix-turn-helix domain-containing protein [Paenibacillus sp. H1-7]ULL13085.1 AraC family transcriptional regulator [Paenibacillus sp. H1-7]
MQQAKLHSLFRPVQGNGRVTSSSYVEIEPSPLLQPYVSCYWASEPVADGTPEASEPDSVPDRVIPDGCTDILFERDLTNGQYRIRYIGLLEHPFSIAYDDVRPSFKLGVRLFPGGAYPLLKSRIAEFTNRSCFLDDAAPDLAGELDELGERIAEAPTLAGKVRLLEQSLTRWLQPAGSSALHDRMSGWLHRIFTSGGTASVQELAAEAVLSSRQMNRDFDQWVGVSPKKFSEIVRFQSLVRQIRSQPQRDWASLAAQYGYFDQSHMIHEFRRFYGDSPVVAAREFHLASDFYNPKR